MIYRCCKNCCIPERCCQCTTTQCQSTIIHNVTGPNVTAQSAFMANTSQDTINVVLNGTPIPLPDSQHIPLGFTTNVANTHLTVANAGLYLIQYGINLNDDYTVGSRVLLNDTPISPSILGPISNSNFTTQFITILPSDAVLQLQLFGLTSAVGFADGVGAYLTVIRLN